MLQTQFSLVSTASMFSFPKALVVPSVLSFLMKIVCLLVGNLC